MSALGTVSAVLLLMVYASLLSGWALSLLWAWFIVGVFGAPALSIPQAIGLALIASFLTHQVDRRKDERVWDDILLAGFVASTAKPLAALALGSVVRWFL